MQAAARQGRRRRRRHRRPHRGAVAAAGRLRRRGVRAGVGAGRGRRRRADLARTPRASCTGSGSPTSWRPPACGRWRGTSGAGTTGGRCCARRWPSRWRRNSASRTTRCTAPICCSRWPARSPRSGCTSVTGWWGSRRSASASWRSFAGGRSVEVDVLVGADGIHSLGAPAAVRRRRPALHRLRRVPRAGAGRAAGRARARGRGAGVDGPGPPLRALLRERRAARQLRRDRRSGGVGRASRGPSRATSPTRSRRSRAGTRRCARSSARSTRPTRGRCSTARRSSAGRAGA